MPFLILTAGEDLPPLPALAAILGDAFGLDTATAAIRARHCWGILGSGLDGAAADALAARCAQAGVAVNKMEAPALPALPAPRIVKKAVIENGRAVFSLRGEPDTAAGPGDISVLAAAPIREDTSRTVKTSEGASANERAVRMGIMAVTGLPIGLGKSREVKKEVRSSELSFYLDILLTGGRDRLRLSSDGFDFSGLKEKKTFSGQMNFRLLCAELAAFAPAALKNAGLKALLGGQPLAALPYDTLADLETETLRLSLAAH